VLPTKFCKNLQLLVNLLIQSTAGRAWRLAGRFTIFGEYRFTNLEASYSDKVDSGGTATNAEIEVKNTVHYFLLGFSYRF
jgi:hypothetical protein